MNISSASTFVVDVLLPLLAWAALLFLLISRAFQHWESRATAKRSFRQKFPVSTMNFLDQRVVAASLVNDPEIQTAIHRLAGETGQPLSRIEKKVQQQALEIVPAFKSTYYFSIGYWLAKLLLLTLYRARRVTEANPAFDSIGRDATVVLIMNHRSNIDVLLVNYLLAGHATVAHAAGEWARLWPLNQLVKLAGNYVVDRNANDPMYRVLLRRYVQMAVSQGIHLAIFPEGGLARDGTIQPLNFGLLNYVATASWPGMDRDVVFIPVSFNYDEVPEQERLLFAGEREFRQRGKLYLAALSLLFCTKLLAYMLRPGHKKYGWACASFGDPVSLKNWQRSRGIDLATLPGDERRRHIDQLGRQLMDSVSARIPVLPIHLLALALLKTQQNGASEDLLFQRAAELRLAMQAAGAPVFDTDQDWSAAFTEALQRLERLGVVRRNPDQSLVQVQQRAPVLQYYANSVKHYLEPAESPAMKRFSAIEHAELDERERNYLRIMSQSYERVLSTNVDGEGFFSSFYHRFLASSPAVAAKFEATDVLAQQRHLRVSLEHMMDFFLSGKPNAHIASIAASHSRAGRDIAPELYQYWLEALLATVGGYDSDFSPSVEVSWRALMAPGIAYMIKHFQPAGNSAVHAGIHPQSRADARRPGIARWIDHWALRTPDKIAIRSERGQCSYAQLAREVVALATGLHQQLGIQPGDRIAFLAQNRPEFILLLFACARLNAILVPLNFRLAEAELAPMLDKAEAKALFLGGQHLSSLPALRAAAGSQLIATVALDKDESRLADRQYPELLQGDAPAMPDQGTMDAPLLIVFTSGSTGNPKGAVLTQEAVHCNALNSAQMHDMTRTDHIITTLPFFHVGGINIQTLPALKVGASVTLVARFDAAGFIELAQKRRPTLTVLVPAQMQQLMKLPEWHCADLSSFRAVTTGSNIVSVDLIRAWGNKGIPVIQVYGCTESSPIAAHQTVEGIGPGLGTVGHAAFHTELKVVDDAGVAVKPRIEGEIVLRGRNIISHYWRDEEATSAAFQDGWLLTGDLGYLDENGRLTVVGRKKQLIISGGENIHPVEIERALELHESIREAAVVGIPHPQWGEIPVAAVTLEQGDDLSEKAIRDHLAQHLGRYKHPHHVLVTEELPHTALGKIAYADVSKLVRERLSL